MALKITFHGHSCFELDDGQAKVLIDPFLAPNNPAALVSADEIEVTHVLLTHGHADHMADAVAVAKRNSAACVAIVEIATWLAEQGIADVSDPNLGGTVRFDWGSVKLVQAFHTSTLPGPGERPYSPTDGTVVGQAGGLIVRIGGLTIYHTGDTALFGDLELIGRREQPDVAILPIGGHYTMDRHDAAYAAELIGAPTVIPCHFDTFEPIATDAVEFAREVEAKGAVKALIMRPGESREL